MYTYRDTYRGEELAWAIDKLLHGYTTKKLKNEACAVLI